MACGHLPCGSSHSNVTVKFVTVYSSSVMLKPEGRRGTKFTEKCIGYTKSNKTTILPEVLTYTVSVSVARSSLLHSSKVPFMETFCKTVNTISDSAFSSILYWVSLAVRFIGKKFRVFRSESFVYSIMMVSCPGKVTSHFSCTVSLLDWTEHMYGIVSPGHSMS